MLRIAVQVDALVEQGLPDARLAVLGREGAPSFVCRPRIEAVGQETHQIGHCLGLEDDRVDARFDALRLLRPNRLAHRLPGDPLHVQACEIEVIASEVSRTGAIRAARREAEAALAGSEKPAVAVGRRRRPRRRAGDVEPRAGHLRGAAGRQRRFERRGAGDEIDVCGRRGETASLAVLEWSERGHVLAVHRRDAGDLHGLVGQAFQRAAVGVVAGRRAAPPLDPDGRRDVEVLGSTAGRNAVVGKARMRFDRAVQRDRGIFGAGGFRLRQHDLAETEGFFAGDHQLAVFRTVT